ncbi:redox-sensitive bicupin YhaK (pirin superfamily) [Neobacillus niacini]|uniref:pirin family protein n=1 Tax=Neobacillus driksii TaxID=3035913 RepID=UPI0027862078|nr:pirin family protein [Neobacillus niacini]MDQ0971131.1 redox-sensitive bicupin YhaK (pirin superfamily) [Neobacillus niacini]
MEIKVIKPQDQALEQFDGGKIIAQKPIGFSGEGSVINRLGPLFYWGWGKSEGEGGIGLHPHQGFEILGYFIKGRGRHQDTLGTISEVGAGGVQVMQAGSGVHHAETLLEPSEAFQIWFEPHLSKAIKQTPTYSKYEHEDFPLNSESGVIVKTILGEHSPIKLVTDAKMYDVEIENGATYKYVLSPNRTLAGLSIRGNGGVIDELEVSFENKDFIILQSEIGEGFTIQPKGENLRMLLIEIPTEVDYPLYRKPR